MEPGWGGVPYHLQNRPFQQAHPKLRRFMEEHHISTPPPSRHGPPTFSWTFNTTNTNTETSLPSLYEFGSHGIGMKERYRTRPGMPRIDSKETFNFDHGALTDHLDETSFMAWF
jgi:hypothetical protein